MINKVVARDERPRAGMNLVGKCFAESCTWFSSRGRFHDPDHCGCLS